MSLFEDLNNQMVSAMKAHDKDTLSTLRLLKSAVMLHKINNKLENISDDVVMEVAAKQVKTHKESIIEFENAGRGDLADNLKREIEVLKQFLPKELSMEEIENEIDKIFEELKPTGKSDLGRVMKEASLRLKNRADFKVISEMVQSKLQ